MATVNDLPDLEMIRDSYVRQIYGEIRELQEKKGVFGDFDAPLYARGLEILGRARALPEICLREDLTPAERDELIRESIQWLSAEFSSLRTALRE